MKRFFKIKRKEQPKPPRKPIRLENPANIGARPPDIREEVDVTPDGGRNLSRNDPGADRAGLAVLPDEGGRMGTRVVFQDTMDGEQELPASGASTSGVGTGGAGYRNQLASKCS